MRRANEANREKFITAAACELEEHGVSDFSIRRVARRCGLSCAAPYKHFESRDELMLEVIRHISKKWLSIMEETLTVHKSEPLREQIVAVCMAYLTFLCTYPEYQTIIFMNDRVFPAEMLAEKGVSVRVVDMYSIKPFAAELLERCARETGAIVTAEEHNIYGGLGSAVAEVLAKCGAGAPTEFVGIQDTFTESGKYGDLMAKYGLDANGVAAGIEKVLARK